MFEPSTDTNRLFELLRKQHNKGLSATETNELSNEIMNMAGNNIVAQFGAKLDAVQAQIAALSESNQAQIAALSESNHAQIAALSESNHAQIAALSESNQAQLDALGKIMQAQSESNQAQSESNQAQSESNQAQLAALGKLLDSRYQLLIWLIAGVGGVLMFILAYGTFVAAG